MALERGQDSERNHADGGQGEEQLDDAAVLAVMGNVMWKFGETQKWQLEWLDLFFCFVSSFMFLQYIADGAGYRLSFAIYPMLSPEITPHRMNTTFVTLF